VTLSIIYAIDEAIRTWGEHFTWPAEHVARLLLACFAGGLVGLERELRGRQAGFRTTLLVCVGSALVMIVSISFAERPWKHDPNFNVNVDPARIAYGIMAGIGFLGAGTIVKTKSSVRGLTTAAGLWCIAAVGMAAGFGLYTLTVISTVVIVAALWILDYFEEGLPKLRYRTVVIRRAWRPGCIAQTIERVKASKLHVLDASFERTDDLQSVDVSVVISFIRREKYYELERALEGDDQYELMATRES
jgi:putative Mg2+ transporter-C (MgtC) family protein